MNWFAVWWIGVLFHAALFAARGGYEAMSNRDRGRAACDGFNWIGLLFLPAAWPLLVLFAIATFYRKELVP